MKASIAITAAGWVVAFAMAGASCSMAAEGPADRPGAPTTAPAGETGQPAPGINLSGGTRLVYRVEGKANASRGETPAEAMFRALKRRVDPDGKLGLVWRPVGLDYFEIIVPPPSAEAAKAKAVYEQARKAAVDAKVRCPDVQRVLRMDPAARNRRPEPDKPESPSPVDELLARYPKQAEKIRAAIQAFDDWQSAKPPLGDVEEVKLTLRDLSKLAYPIEFHIAVSVGDVAPDDRARLVADLAKGLPAPAGKLWVEAADRNITTRSGAVAGERNGKPYVLVYTAADKSMVKTRAADGWKFKSAYADRDQWGSPAVGFEFDQAGAKKFAALTGGNKGKLLALNVDGKAISIATIQSQISSRGIITGSFTEKEVADLARRLQAGALPGKLSPEPISETTVP